MTKTSTKRVLLSGALLLFARGCVLPELIVDAEGRRDNVSLGGAGSGGVGTGGAAVGGNAAGGSVTSAGGSRNLGGQESSGGMGGGAMSPGGSESTGGMDGGGMGGALGGSGPWSGGVGGVPVGGTGGSASMPCNPGKDANGAPLLEDDIPSFGDATHLTLTRDRVWMLRGARYVADQQVLTINPCTKIKGVTGASQLIVSRGGKLYAQGTANEPIIFTSDKPVGQRGKANWAGIALLGKASNNISTDVVLEAMPDAPENRHGGGNDNDNSGALEYVRIEFTGASIQGANANAITLGSVGRGTKLSHLMVSATNDDCFYWKGGTVNADHLICNRSVDDMFDIDSGYRGNLSYLFGRSAFASQDPAGFEVDSNSAAPATNLTAKYATLCASGVTGSRVTVGMVLRTEMRGVFDNVVVTGFDVGVDVEDDFGAAETPNATLINALFFSNLHNPANPGEANNDNLFSEASWFSLGSGNSTAAAPFTLSNCNSPGGPSVQVTDSKVGAFFNDPSWLTGSWVDWSEN